MTEFVPYDHQMRALDDTWNAMKRDGCNPVCSIPTGGGKTIIAGWLARGYLSKNPDSRIAVVAHVGELVKQNHETIENILQEPVGIYNAGLNRKDNLQRVICGSIQSMWKRTDFGTATSPKVGKFDLIIVDEAHRIPEDHDTMYRQFLTDQGHIEGTEQGPKIVGLSATPYRLGTGKIYGMGRMFSELAHNMSVLELIDKGILCAPITQRGAKKTNFSKIKIKGGDFEERGVVEAMHPNLPFICKEIVEKAGDRKKWIVFAVRIDQAENIAEMFRTMGVSSEPIHSKMKKKERERILADFKAGKFKALINVNCLTEGFDDKLIDLVALVRPTKSTGLYVQMVGRGLRNHPEKKDVLILDFGQNVSRHGPIDIPLVKAESTEKKGQKGPPMKNCPECGCEVPISKLVCPECGHNFPKPQSKLQTKASLLGVLSKPMWFDVSKVAYEQHRSIYSGNTTLKCNYTIFDPDDPSTKQVVTEWLPFNSEKPSAKRRCQDYWTQRGGQFPIPDNPQRAMDRISELTLKPLQVQIKRQKDNPKFITVSKYKFKQELQMEVA